ncbi:general secretion pathway protein GspK [bacterium]|nr:general secretion pathway protein GspK [bacterium]
MTARDFQRPRGVVLVMVCFILFFLITLTTAYVYSIQTELRLARNYVDDVKAYYLAKAGIYRCIAEMKRESMSGKLNPRADLPEDAETLKRFEEIFLCYPLGDGNFTVKYQDDFGQKGLGPMDEASLINISSWAENKSYDSLRQLFRIALVDEEVINKLVDCLIDYVDSDDFPELSGAEYTDYEKMDPPRSIPNAPMQDASEFLTIIDMVNYLDPGSVDYTLWYGTPGYDTNDWMQEVWHNYMDEVNPAEPPECHPGIKRFVTVNSRTSQVNRNTASEDVLRVVDPDSWENVIEQRRTEKVQGSTGAMRIRSYGRCNNYSRMVEWLVNPSGSGYPTLMKSYEE